MALPQAEREQAQQRVEETLAQPSSIYIVNINFDGTDMLPKEVEESKSRVVILFGFDPRDEQETPLLTPFPLGKGETNEELSEWMTGILRPDFAKQFSLSEEILRFPTLYDLAPYFSPYMRHEIGYSLLMLAEEEATEAGRPRSLRDALRNTGNIFLMSVGVRWHMNSVDEILLEEQYNQYFEQFWGKAPKKAHRNIEGTDLLLRAMEQRGWAHIKMSQDWPDIADMGHGLEYMMMRTAKKGGLFEVVAVGGGIPPDYGTPIGAGYLALRFSNPKEIDPTSQV